MIVPPTEMTLAEVSARYVQALYRGEHDHAARIRRFGMRRYPNAAVWRRYAMTRRRRP